jgi:GTP-binding protein
MRSVSPLLAALALLAAGASVDAYVAPALAPRGLGRASAVAGRVPALALRAAARRGSLLRMTAAAKSEVDYDTVTADNLRNVAIIAHVDHGKTTLVDKLLDEAEISIENDDGGDRLMDSMDLERERGITIMSKVTSMAWKKTKLNIVDTPGHADFGGEVERVMSIVDGVCLLVDATEGPMAQTKFVLMKALARGIKPLVVINKVDRDSSRVEEVEGEVFDLMVNLGATDEQLDYTTIYASGRNGWATKSYPDGPRENMMDLLDAVVESVPAPKVLDREDFSMVVTMIEGDAFLGRVCTGRVASGAVKVGDAVHALDNSGKKVDTGRITKIMSRKGAIKMELKQATAGDIIQVAGLNKATVGYTIAAPEVTEALPADKIDPPTLVMTFCPNDSPLAGKDKQSTKLTSQMIGQRLMAEAETNVGIRVKPSEERGEAFDVMGRGELQLGILVENMRREGFELGVCPPKVLYQQDKNGQRLEPIEEVVIEVDDEFTGPVINKLSERKVGAEAVGGSRVVGQGRIAPHSPSSHSS